MLLESFKFLTVVILMKYYFKILCCAHRNGKLKFVLDQNLVLSYYFQNASTGTVNMKCAMRILIKTFNKTYLPHCLSYSFALPLVDVGIVQSYHYRGVDTSVF